MVVDLTADPVQEKSGGSVAHSLARQLHTITCTCVLGVARGCACERAMHVSLRSIYKLDENSG